MALGHPDLSQATWRKSSYSSSTGQNCVEVARNLCGIVAVRDSVDESGTKLTFTSEVWQAFIFELKVESLSLKAARFLDETAVLPLAARLNDL
jgi:hypothetical protein